MWVLIKCAGAYVYEDCDIDSKKIGYLFGCQIYEVVGHFIDNKIYKGSRVLYNLKKGGWVHQSRIKQLSLHQFDDYILLNYYQQEVKKLKELIKKKRHETK